MFYISLVIYSYMQNVKVGDIMTRDPIAVGPKTSLLDCARQMVKKNTGSLILKEGNKIFGLLTQEDILWALVRKSQNDLESIKAIDISRRKIYAINPYDSVEEAMKKMQRARLERLPVVSKGQLVGLLTMKDIIHFNPGLVEDLRSLFDIKEESEKLKRVSSKSEKEVLEGVCEECGDFDVLHNVEGRLLCEECKDEI